MKKLLLLAIIGVAILGKSAFAADFPIIAKIPNATSVEFIISEIKPVPGGKDEWSSHPSTTLDFSTAGTGMTYDNDNGIWVGSRYFAIDLSPVDVNGDPSPGNYASVTVSYSGQVVPSGQNSNDGLNKRAILTAAKAKLGEADEVLQIGPLGQAGTFNTITQSDITGGWLRYYVGLADGALDNNGDPVVPGSVPFTNADKPGTYEGKLTITATLT